VFAQTQSELLKMVYPVGSIYISTGATNPGTLFGGTWERFGNGRVLVGMNESDGDFNAASKTGGAKSNVYTPSVISSGGGTSGYTTLTLDQVPAHYHRVYGGPNGDVRLMSGKAYLNGGDVDAWAPWIGSGYNAIDNIYTDTQGGGQGHAHTTPNHTHTMNPMTISTMQPYITVYMWRRTA
jgi:hypothetical protein